MVKHIRHELPINRPALLSIYALLVFAVGFCFDAFLETRFDPFFHDAAIVQKERKSWEHVAIVALDQGVPGSVSRRQALPLYALAAKNAFEAGATAVFLDARFYEYDTRANYTQCVESYQTFPVANTFKWLPATQITPFSLLTQEQFERFFIAKPAFHNDDAFTSLTLLQSYFGETLLPLDFFEEQNNINALHRLIADASVHRRSEGAFNASFRWMNMQPEAVIPKLTALHNRQLGVTQDYEAAIEQCDGKSCQRVRFSAPKNQFLPAPSFPIIPVSELAACDTLHNEIEFGQIKHSELLKDKIVILQMTEPAEATDIKVTPMMSALGSPNQFVSGPQFLADSLETQLQQDAPVRPSSLWRWLLLGCIAAISVFGAAQLRISLIYTMPLFTLISVWGLCFINDTVQLWPVMASLMTCVLGNALVLATHISMGTAKSKLVAQYMPQQIRSLLLKSGSSGNFMHRRIDAVILMSDIAKYSNVTSELEAPAYVFQMLNLYFEDTTLTTQQQFNGWLESYVGDLVCFYWPVVGETLLKEQQKLALQAAVDMSQRQQDFFSSLEANPALDINKASLEKISSMIGAGIGLTSGEVMMGNLGPENGIQKFGCLGDPLNLASRVESLTRHFSSDILITEELVEPALELNLKLRKVARVVVKGRLEPVTLYGLGIQSDMLFDQSLVASWENWYASTVGNISGVVDSCPEQFTRDHDTILQWLRQDLYDPQIDAFILKDK
ncbi:MAG: hypothetical protein GJ680_14145 [Alteromonadaceae bacterium]|nr:hypothetical protein [Alteromonadaceae bacterium]